jgi:hypothetical protein
MMEEAIKELFYWQYNYTGSFTQRLFDLFQKADPVNVGRLSMGFPHDYEAWRAWSRAEDTEQFFRDRGFEIPPRPARSSLG